MRTAAVQDVAVTDDSLIVDLVDGRTVSVPLAWYPRLLHGQPEERNNWRLIGQGEGIHYSPPHVFARANVDGGRPSDRLNALIS